MFANFVLADEINRAPAKVQSALLEVMAEHHVSIGGTTYDVPDAVPRARDPEPDRVRGRVPAARGAARPLPHEGARRLPDRDRGGRDRAPHGRPPASGGARCSTRPTLVRLQATADAVFVHHAVVDYAVRLVLATREPAERGLPELAPLIAFGASPRASLGLVAAGRALALLRGPQLRAAPGRLRRRARGPPPPARAVLRGAGRRRQPRRHRQPRPCHRRGTSRRAEPGPHRGDCVERWARAAESGEHHGPRLARVRAGGAAPPRADVTRRLDGLLQGDHQGLVPGRGHRARRGPRVPAGRRRPPDRLEPHRPHRPSPHVRDTIADRELETWVVADRSASLDFGTAGCEKRDLALAARGRRRLPHRPRRQPPRRRARSSPAAGDSTPARAGRSALIALLRKLRDDAPRHDADRRRPPPTLGTHARAVGAARDGAGWSW